MAGLESRYQVQKINDVTGKHGQCRFFVLDPQHDPNAIPALLSYADSCAADYPELAADLREWAVNPQDPGSALTTVSITTRKPEKYTLLDAESGEQWVIRDGRWILIDALSAADRVEQVVPEVATGPTQIADQQISEVGR